MAIFDQGLQVKVGADLTSFNMAMNKVVANVKKTATRISFIMAAAGVGGTALAHSFLGAAREAEGFRVRLNVLLGSVEEGNRMFNEMAQYASTVSFEYAEIMDERIS